MRSAKKSSEWDLFVEHQRREHRTANPRSWGWLKAVGVAVVGTGLGVVVFLLARPR